MTSLHNVLQILEDVLQVSTDGWSGDTELLGAIPEFDSMAVVSVITALEDNFGIMVEDDEVSAETFASVGSLVSFVESKL